MKYTFKDLSKIFNLTVPQLKNIYSQNARTLFEYIIINHHRFCAIDETNLDKFQNIIKEFYSKKVKERSKWSKDAIECYKNRLMCKNCYLYNLICKDVPKINGKPPMKLEVLNLVANYGLPTADEL